MPPVLVFQISTFQHCLKHHLRSFETLIIIYENEFRIQCFETLVAVLQMFEKPVYCLGNTGRTRCLVFGDTIFSVSKPQFKSLEQQNTFENLVMVFESLFRICLQVFRNTGFCCWISFQCFETPVLVIENLFLVF